MTKKDTNESSNKPGKPVSSPESHPNPQGEKPFDPIAVFFIKSHDEDRSPNDPVQTKPRPAESNPFLSSDTDRKGFSPEQFPKRTLPTPPSDSDGALWRQPRIEQFFSLRDWLVAHNIIIPPAATMFTRLAMGLLLALAAGVILLSFRRNSPSLPPPAPVASPQAVPPDAGKNLPPGIDAAWLEAHEPEQELAHRAILGALLARNAAERTPHVLHPQFNDPPPLPVVPESITIHPMFGWEEPDDHRFAFMVRSSINQTGFLAEVRVAHHEAKLDWPRFVQHHHRTFSSFAASAPADPMPFYITIRKVNPPKALSKPIHQFDYYELSGTNPNEWHPAVAKSGSPVAKRLNELVPWFTKKLLVLELTAPQAGNNALPIIEINSILDEDWEPDPPSPAIE